MKTEAYAHRVELEIPYDAAVERATRALKEQGFGVLTEIDIRAKLKEKIGADFRRYVILGACNPPLVHRALQSELEVMSIVSDNPELASPTKRTSACRKRWRRSPRLLDSGLQGQ